MCMHRFIVWIIFFATLEGEKNKMITCSTQTKLSCSQKTYVPDCDPSFLHSEYPSLFGTNESLAANPLNFRSKLILKNGTVAVLLIWQQYFTEYAGIVKGFQLTMEGIGGLDVGSGRCIILQLKNQSLSVYNVYETFYLMINNIQPMSLYAFELYSLPRESPFLPHYGTLETRVDTKKIGDQFPEFSGNWDQYIECIYNSKTEHFDIAIEVPPKEMKLSSFEVNIFDDLEYDDIFNINISSYEVLQDRHDVFSDGYIFLTYKMKQAPNFIEVWVTPIDPFWYHPSKCICYIGRQHQCVPCRTATTKCSIGKEFLTTLTYNETDHNSSSSTQLLAWLCSTTTVLCLCIMTGIAFVFRHRFSCSGKCNCSKPSAQTNETYSEYQEETESHLVPAIPSSVALVITEDIAEIDMPLVDSLGSHQRQGLTSRSSVDVSGVQQRTYDDLYDMTETYFTFIPPETISEMSRTLSEQIVDINREVLP